MAENSRIEDLRKRYHENPRRFFAPLANEYRKAGFLDRALLLCQKHVPEQPDNMNGLVVFGQTLFESGNTAEAQEPFERALTLDPENLIALRHLGDIARIGGDVPTAKKWYERVLELDRRNDEVLDLLQEMGVGPEPVEAPAPRPSTAAGGLISVASSVSVSGGPDLGMIDLDMPAAPTPTPLSTPKISGPGKTVVINAQALADRDRSEAAGSSAITQPVEAVRPPVVEAAEPPAPRPSKRASLLDIDFDFSETAEPEAKPVVPQAPVMGAEAAEYGFADVSPAATVSPETVEPLELDSGSHEPLALEPTASMDALMVETTGDMAPLGLEPTIADSVPAPEPALPAGDFELADFSAEVSPLAGLEASEFTSETVAPLAELENDTASASISSVSALEGLDRPDVEPGTVEPLSGIADLPLLDTEEPARAPLIDVSAAPLPEVAAEAELELPSVPMPEAPSAKPKPRMTKADLSSLPLLADFGLEDDEPEPVSAPLRPSKATPAFVTETMAALYVKQGHIAEAVEVYRQLVVQSPNDSGLKAKLAELERMQQAEQPAPAPAAVDVDMPEFEVPSESSEPEPAAANAAMADISFGGIGIHGQGSPTPVVTPAVATGPSAREFFGSFARRAAVTAAVVAATVVGDAEEVHAEPATQVPAATSTWPLDALFGAAQDVRDMHAAEVLAGVGTFQGPDGGTGLDALLTTPAQPARRSVPRASEMLKFDQFFQAPGTAAAAAEETPPATPGDIGDDDLDQFHGWLQGLKK